MTSLNEILPEELLVVIVQCLAEIPDFRPHFNDRNVSRHIRFLALVNKEFRRICFPLLFSYLKRKRFTDLEHLKDTCREIPELWPLYRTSADSFVTAVLGEILPQILSSLTDLLRIDLHYHKIDSQLLAVINSHPTLAAVSSTTESFADLPSDLSLSKIILKFIIVSNKDPRSYVPVFRLRPGCGISQLSGLETVTVTRLRGLRMQLGGKDLSWLPVFAARHPHLNSLRTCTKQPSLKSRPTYVLLFLDAVDGRATINAFTIFRPTIDLALESWNTFLSLQSLVLTDDLALALSKFHTLRVLGLPFICRHLDPGDKMPMLKKRHLYEDTHVERYELRLTGSKEGGTMS
ncbi:hypothetical protein C8J56DRAFT_907932 [Mycena floridula]|nr:hypothetical protein C8J56DRAFT_907932 [Mycena floridula]